MKRYLSSDTLILNINYTVWLSSIYDAHSGRTMSLLESGRGGLLGCASWLCRIYDMRARCTCECAPVASVVLRKKVPSGSRRSSRFVSILGFAPEFHMRREFVEVLSTISYGCFNVIDYNSEAHGRLQTIFYKLNCASFRNVNLRISEWIDCINSPKRLSPDNFQYSMFSYIFR